MKTNWPSRQGYESELEYSGNPGIVPEAHLEWEALGTSLPAIAHGLVATRFAFSTY